MSRCQRECRQFEPGLPLPENSRPHKGGCFFVSPMKIIIAPDSFKGSLTSLEAAEAMAHGVRQVYPAAELVLLPLADGGEGTVEALVTATGGQRVTTSVCGPACQSFVNAAWALLGPQGETAVIEMAAAAGLTLFPSELRNPLYSTTYGVGQLMLAAAYSGAKQIIVGLGGSATNDGGAGALQAMGVKFFDVDGELMQNQISGQDLIQISRLKKEGLSSVFNHVKVIIASDVTNPLLGVTGASAVYGPQKGATKAIAIELERAMRNYSAVLSRDSGRDVSNWPGAGAAGGLGAGLMACFDATVVSGIDLILDAARFEEKLQGADFVFTGEGRIDAQTLQGKTISGVLKRCQKLGNVPVIAFAGSVNQEAAIALGLSDAFEISEGLPRDEEMRNAAKLLSEAVARFMGQLASDWEKTPTPNSGRSDPYTP